MAVRAIHDLARAQVEEFLSVATFDLYDTAEVVSFANASMCGTLPIRSLFFGFPPDEPELFSVDRDILITPVPQR
ncbi:uncharacterized protein BXZ73DRAFT_106999 [Epithele typhae]|uniref:uncharacterized protein n=1 Tax=Epithele typhae TaxID=378194 RepID=UPI002007808B|nr:uncharacterized protein BXZ73DRAFT_106999 [Epithele typhae]KAH9913120.1 hypothetical protein BXZ73DRAFT_106999 [Epithele typhae]